MIPILNCKKLLARRKINLKKNWMFIVLIFGWIILWGHGWPGPGLAGQQEEVCGPPEEAAGGPVPAGGAGGGGCPALQPGGGHSQGMQWLAVAGRWVTLFFFYFIFFHFFFFFLRDLIVLSLGVAGCPTQRVNFFFFDTSLYKKTSLHSLYVWTVLRFVSCVPMSSTIDHWIF